MTGASATPALTVNVAPFDVNGPGVTTVTLAVVAVATSAAGTVAVRLVVETNMVGNVAPFQLIVEPATKFVPMTVSVNDAAPVVTEAGLRLVIVGVAPTMN